MFIKIVYILVFAIIDLVIWLILNKPGTFSKKLQYVFAVLFALFIIVHAVITQSAYLLPWKTFFNLVVVTCVPVLLFAWYTGITARRKTRNIPEGKFGNGVLKVANVIFLYAINITALVIQVLMVLGYYPEKL